jgi:hypothetical protein
MSLITEDDIARARARLALSEDEAALLEETLHIAPTPSAYLAPPEINQRLAETIDCLKIGNLTGARHLLADTYPYAVKNPRFWWIVAQAAGTRKATVLALIRVIQLRPRSRQAWTALRHEDPAAAQELATVIRPPRTRRRRKHR